MQIEQVPIKDLAFDPANARKHSQKNLSAIKGSLKKFGQQKPIVIDKNNIVVAGNGTLAAAKDLGWDKIDAVRTALTGLEAIAFALADNRTAELAEWENNTLVELLTSLHIENFDIGEIGFDSVEFGIESPDFEPASESDQGKLDEKKKVECPECGHAFEPK